MFTYTSSWILDDWHRMIRREEQRVNRYALPIQKLVSRLFQSESARVKTSLSSTHEKGCRSVRFLVNLLKACLFLGLAELYLWV